MEGLDIDLIQETYLEVFTSPRKDQAQKELHHDFPDLSNAMKALSMEREDKATIANYWLHAQNVPLKDLKSIGITTRIDRAEKALKVITWLVRLFNWAQPQQAGSPSRIIWMIDEFQRMTRCRKPVQDEINGCLQSVFNRCPRSFTLFLSFSGTPAKKMPPWLSKELADRIGMEKIIVLPPLTTFEANQFFLDVLKQYRDDGSPPPSSSFPFTEESISLIIDIVQQKAEMKPRTIMQACSAVLEEADMQIASGTLKFITKDFVNLTLKNRNFIDTEDEG